MSGVSFSHQFTQRWIQSPDQVRAAIVQELKDIMTLLQTDITTEAFEFTQPNLDSYLDDIYAEDEAAKALIAQQRAAEQAEREADLKDQQAAVAQAVDTDSDTHNKVAQSTATTDATHSDTAHTASQNTQVDPTEPQATDAAATATLTISPASPAPVNEHATAAEPTTQQPQGMHKISQATLSNQDPATTQAATDTTVISNEQQAFIYELENRIDDYLSEQMALMSEDLKQWLRAEVQRQLQQNS